MSRMVICNLRRKCTISNKVRSLSRTAKPEAGSDSVSALYLMKQRSFKPHCWHGPQNSGRRRASSCLSKIDLPPCSSSLATTERKFKSTMHNHSGSRGPLVSGSKKSVTIPDNSPKRPLFWSSVRKSRIRPLFMAIKCTERSLVDVCSFASENASKNSLRTLSLARSAPSSCEPS